MHAKRESERERDGKREMEREGEAEAGSEGVFTRHESKRSVKGPIILL